MMVASCCKSAADTCNIFCAVYFQAPSEALREAARALMAAATDPRACGEPGCCDAGAYMQLLTGARPASAQCLLDQEVRP